ncbi:MULTISPECIES: LexA family protein [Methylobacteriaceae]|jgi:DNA polymerase V|uniref:Peptidase S24 n=3 Tax=Methylobacterium TaxID=407 RepID=A0A512J1J8_9HYPH|nr:MULTISPECIES: translesion error-prone DNA polymerase V autoproteolytic subunit [Methylobacterium]MBY0294983.1 translesion error-prone DNA polymerase V autoproteolytic subunit [Methylobacterium sp.]MDN3621699.1 translesion error-prone DNA polymerase V autoproteolytic subunit [Methylobacterium isbiliense]GEP03729.1 peptidase S24 [Methylobacterium oxalidis]GJE00657.1 Protein UmuD [Methylobacterium isbiliense]GJE33667.1 Protein UmuD [Methylobacterium oxalidis]
MQVSGVTIGLPTPIPILAKPVRAGFPSPADDFIEEEIDLQRLLVANRPATFLVRVAGDSMMLARLFDGDLAVVDRSLTPRNGDVVVVDIDGERSFKVWRRQGPRVTLSFANPRFPEFRLSPDAVVEVWGVVSGSVNPRRRSGE